MGVIGTPGSVAAQAITDLQTPDTPLVLKAQGSVFVGGEKAEQTQVELGGLGPAGHITVRQMYVRYMVPLGGDGKPPVVMVHGATLTGKSWETTPDGRMGWDEYFVRKGHPVYVPDQVGRGRSGFDQAVFNDVRAGSAPASSLPPGLRFSDEVVWPNFRFGSKPVIDLVRQVCITFEEETQGGRVVEGPVPADMAAEVATAREALLEAVADVDESLTERYLEGKPIAEDEIKAAVRKATLSLTMAPRKIRNSS